MELIQGRREHLASYVAALRAGWSADNVRGAAAAAEELERIERGADEYLASVNWQHSEADERTKYCPGFGFPTLPT